MAKRLSAALAVLLMLESRIPAQQFPPGYVDPVPLLAAAAREIGEASLKCITYSGTGYGGAVGQTYENAVNVDWPRIDALANYTRSINSVSVGSTERPRRRISGRPTTPTASIRGRSTVTVLPWPLHPRTPNATNWICG